MKPFNQFLFEKATSQQQLKFILAKRSQYENLANTPEKWKWIWNKDWDPKKGDFDRLPVKV